MVLLCFRNYYGENFTYKILSLVCTILLSGDTHVTEYTLCHMGKTPAIATKKRAKICNSPHMAMY